jgi:hypothetical protein
MTFLRWLGDWAYGLWISLFPPEDTLGCGHKQQTGRRPVGSQAWCWQCGNHRVIVKSGKAPR